MTNGPYVSLLCRGPLELSLLDDDYEHHPAEFERIILGTDSPAGSGVQPFAGNYQTLARGFTTRAFEFSAQTSSKYLFLILVCVAMPLPLAKSTIKNLGNFRTEKARLARRMRQPVCFNYPVAVILKSLAMSHKKN